MIPCGGQVVTFIPIFPNRNLVRPPGFWPEGGPRHSVGGVGT